MSGLVKALRPFRLHLLILVIVGIIWIAGGASFFTGIFQVNEYYFMSRELVSLMWLLATMVVFIMILQNHFKNELREGEMHKLYFESSNSGILVFSEEGKLVRINSAGKDIMGYNDKESELKGAKFDILFRPYFGEKDYELGINIEKMPTFKELAMRGKSLIDSSIISGKDERIFIRIGTVVTTAPGRNGEILVIATIDDIREKIRLDKSILSLNTILEKRVAERTQELRDTIEELEKAKKSFNGDQISVNGKAR